MAKQTSKEKAIGVAMGWSRRVDLPAYIYETEKGWKWAADKIIAHSRSANVETVDANALRNHLRKAGSAKSKRKARTSAENGKKGGRPRKSPRAE